MPIIKTAVQLVGKAVISPIKGAFAKLLSTAGGRFAVMVGSSVLLSSIIEKITGKKAAATIDSDTIAFDDASQALDDIKKAIKDGKITPNEYADIEAATDFLNQQYALYKLPDGRWNSTISDKDQILLNKLDDVLTTARTYIQNDKVDDKTQPKVDIDRTPNAAVSKVDLVREGARYINVQPSMIPGCLLFVGAGSVMSENFKRVLAYSDDLALNADIQAALVKYPTMNYEQAVNLMYGIYARLASFCKDAAIDAAAASNDSNPTPRSTYDAWRDFI